VHHCFHFQLLDEKFEDFLKFCCFLICSTQKEVLEFVSKLLMMFNSRSGCDEKKHENL
jgi:hypothetical protein